MISDMVGLNPKLQTTAMHFGRSSSTSGENTFLKNNAKYIQNIYNTLSKKTSSSQNILQNH